jgi:hypothetical protein
MAVTTQSSTEYTNATATPVTLNEANVYHGRVRIAYFTHDQDGVGDAGSSVALCALPAGKVKVLLSSSNTYVNWTTSSATLDLGWDAYTNISGTAVAADPDGLLDGLDVDAVGYQNFGADQVATGGTYTFETQGGVVIRATSPTAMVDGDDLVGYLLYVVD